MTDDSALTSARFGPGWGNPRTATALHVMQSDDRLLIQTTLYGLERGTLDVTFNGLYVIIEGILVGTMHRGRYARHVPELAQGSYDVVKVSYTENGKLMIEGIRRENA